MICFLSLRLGREWGIKDARERNRGGRRGWPREEGTRKEVVDQGREDTKGGLSFGGEGWWLELLPGWWA